MKAAAGDKPERLGDAPIEPQFHAMMNDLARGLDEILNRAHLGADRKVGFALLVFPFASHEGRCNYISNTERADVVTLLKEQLARFEGQPEIKGRA